MEREQVSTAKALTSRHLASRSRENTNVSERQLKSKTFKSKARQIWMANLITRQRTTESSIKTLENTEKKDRNSRALATDVVSRPPSVKRKGTPEIFPMSSEMKETLILLGNFDFLPEEERIHHSAVNEGEKKSSVNKFRLKTKQRIIQPQRFLRGMRSGNTHKQTTVKEETVSGDNLVTTDDLIDSKTGNIIDNSEQGKASEKSHICEDESRITDNLHQGREITSARVISSYNSRPTIRNAWNRSFQKYQTVYTISNPNSKANSRSGLKRSRKIHLSSKTWQADTDLSPIRNHPIRRAVSLGFESIVSSEDSNVDSIDAMRDGRTIDEITTDIQLRCSKWFEFRQRILKQRDTR